MHFADIIRNNQCFNIIFSLIPVVLMIGVVLLSLLKTRSVFRKVLRISVVAILFVPVVAIDLLLLVTRQISGFLIITTSLLIIGVLCYIFRRRKLVFIILAVLTVPIIFVFSRTIISFVLTATDSNPNSCSDIAEYLKVKSTDQTVYCSEQWKKLSIFMDKRLECFYDYECLAVSGSCYNHIVISELDRYMRYCQLPTEKEQLLKLKRYDCQCVSRICTLTGR